MQLRNIKTNRGYWKIESRDPWKLSDFRYATLGDERIKIRYIRRLRCSPLARVRDRLIRYKWRKSENSRRF